MKQINSTSFSKLIYGVKLFRDDIEEVLERCKNKSMQLEKSDSKNIYESVDDVIKHRGNFPSELNIIGDSFATSFDISR